MITIIKIILILSIFSYLSIKKYSLLITMGTLTILFAIFFVPIHSIIPAIRAGILSLNTLIIMVLIWVTVSFTKLIDGEGDVKKATNLLLQSAENPIFLFPFFPALIGLFPMPGGALISAPMLKRMSENTGIDRNSEAAINFWFRHIWEPIWLLYPGIIIVSSKDFLNTTIFNVGVHQIFMTIFAFLGGWFFLILLNAKRITKKNSEKKPLNWLKFFYYLWPIILLVILVVLIRYGNLSLIVIILIVSLLYAFFKKISIEKFFGYFKKGFNVNLILLIPIIYFFKYLVENSNFKNTIIHFTQNSHIPLILILLSVPFFLGMLFGVTVGFISVGFPLLSHFFFTTTGNIDFYNFTIFFLGGYIGVLFSPLHLCLLVSKEYFKANLGKMYIKMALPGLFLLVFSLILIKWLY